MPTGNFDINELKRRMQGATQALKHELGGLRTGRASASMLEPVQVDAYGTHMPLNQLATISVPEPRLLSVQVWDKSMVKAVEKAIVDSNLGLSPATEGQVLRLRIPELNEERRKELVKVAHKYAEAAKVAVRHVRRAGVQVLLRLLERLLGGVGLGLRGLLLDFGHVLARHAPAGAGVFGQTEAASDANDVRVERHDQLRGRHAGPHAEIERVAPNHPAKEQVQALAAGPGRRTWKEVADAAPAAHAAARPVRRVDVERERAP